MAFVDDVFIPVRLRGLPFFFYLVWRPLAASLPSVSEA